MPETPAAKPEEGRHRHHRRSRSSRHEPKRPSGQPRLLSRLGRRLSRRAKLVVCLAILGSALAMSAVVRGLEAMESVSAHSLVSAVGFAPAIFVTRPAAGASIDEVAS